MSGGPATQPAEINGLSSYDYCPNAMRIRLSLQINKETRAFRAAPRAGGGSRRASHVPKKGGQLVAPGLGVRPAEVDQVVSIAAVEVQVGEEVGLGGDAVHGIAERR